MRLLLLTQKLTWELMQDIDIVTAFDAVHGRGSALQPLQRQHRLS